MWLFNKKKYLLRSNTRPRSGKKNAGDQTNIKITETQNECSFAKESRETEEFGAQYGTVADLSNAFEFNVYDSRRKAEMLSLGIDINTDKYQSDTATYSCSQIFATCNKCEDETINCNATITPKDTEPVPSTSKQYFKDLMLETDESISNKSFLTEIWEDSDDETHFTQNPNVPEPVSCTRKQFFEDLMLETDESISYKCFLTESSADSQDKTHATKNPNVTDPVPSTSEQYYEDLMLESDESIGYKCFLTKLCADSQDETRATQNPNLTEPVPSTSKQYYEDLMLESDEQISNKSFLAEVSSKRKYSSAFVRSSTETFKHSQFKPQSKAFQPTRSKEPSKIIKRKNDQICQTSKTIITADASTNFTHEHDSLLDDFIPNFTTFWDNKYACDVKYAECLTEVHNDANKYHDESLLQVQIAVHEIKKETFFMKNIIECHCGDGKKLPYLSFPPHLPHNMEVQTSCTHQREEQLHSQFHYDLRNITFDSYMNSGTNKGVQEETHWNFGTKFSNTSDSIVEDGKDDEKSRFGLEIEDQISLEAEISSQELNRYLPITSSVKYDKKNPKQEANQENISISSFKDLKQWLQGKRLVEEQPSSLTPKIKTKDAKLSQIQIDIDVKETKTNNHKPRKNSKFSCVDDSCKCTYTCKTGYMTECRRVDVVLVLQDHDNPKNEKMKVNFLMNAIKAGLELECVPGKMKINKNAIFVKIHAPDDILDYYAERFNMKYYFMDPRLDVMKPTAYCMDKLERDWIEILRNCYKPEGFSNIMRSRIVHKILLNIPFSKDINEIGLNRLLQREVIKDAYALHDGPYFLCSHMDIKDANARQLLHYSWAKKILSFQPLHLINEYFGGRVAFYFAFCGFYNIALLFLAIGTIFYSITEVFDEEDTPFIDDSLSSKKYLCPTCKIWNMCPFTKIGDMTLEVYIGNFIDNPFLIFFCLFISVGAIIFTMIWNRYENYLIWLWGIDLKEVRNTVRSEHDVDPSGYERSNMTGVWLQRKYTRVFAKRIYSVAGLLIVSVLLIVFFWTFLGFFKYVLTYQLARLTWNEWGSYLGYVLLAFLHTAILTYYDEISVKLALYITHRENHRFTSLYEASLRVKAFLYTASFTFPTLVFYCFIKGHYLHGSPFGKTTWKKMFGVGTMECSPFTCLPEVWTLLIAMFVTKYVVLRMKQFFTKIHTDYTYGKEFNKNIPDYEREYTLLAWPPSLLLKKYCFIMVQLAQVVIFSPACPFAPFFALIYNIYDLRHQAQWFLLAHRRPLLTRDYGLGTWRWIILGIIVTSAFTNGFLISTQTKTLEREVFVKDRKTMLGFLDWSLKEYKSSTILVPTSKEMAYEIANYWEKELLLRNISCYQYMPGLSKAKSSYPQERERVQSMLNALRKLFIITYEHMVIFLIILFHFITPDQPNDVSNTLAVERRIKALIRHRKLVNAYKMK